MHILTVDASSTDNLLLYEAVDVALHERTVVPMVPIIRSIQHL